MVLRAKMMDTVSADALALPSVEVGNLQRARGTPDRYVVVFDEDLPVARVEVFGFKPRAAGFERCLVWHEIVLVGLGDHVHMVCISDRSTRTLSLGSYFCDFAATDRYLLIASGERLVRIDQERTVVWTSEQLGADGVLVLEASPAVIRGLGEWDPPGGWREFVLDAGSGRRLE